MLDAEIVAVDRGKASGGGSSAQEALVGATGGADGGGGGVKLRAFQELSTRARGNITSDQAGGSAPMCLVLDHARSSCWNSCLGYGQHESTHVFDKNAVHQHCMVRRCPRQQGACKF